MKTARQSFEQLSTEERSVVGSADDYAWDDAEEVPKGRPRADSAQFSLRVERSTLDVLQARAAERGVTFSEVMREAIDLYLRLGASADLYAVQATASGQTLVRAQGKSIPAMTASRSEAGTEFLPRNESPREGHVPFTSRRAIG